MAKQSGTDLDDVSGGSGKRARIDDTITLFKFPPKKWVTFRIFGPIFTYGGYWVTTKTKEGKPTKFYTPCPSYDPATQQRDSTIYDPWRDLEAKQADMERDAKTLNFSKSGFTNAIFRKAQQDAPRKLAKHTKGERKTGFKEKDSDSWTPIVALRLPAGAISKLKEQAGLNVIEVKGQTKAFPITHPKYGCDVRIMHNPDKAPADQYQVSIGERSKITEEEEALLKWDLSDLESAPDAAEVKRDFESWASRNGVKVSSKKKKAKDEDEDDEDLPDDDGDDDEDEDEPKSKKSKSKSKASKKSKKSKDEDDEDEDEDEDDDSDEDEDLDDDDEDEDEPKSKKKSKGKPAAKSKSKGKSKDEDEDEDDFDEDEDEDEDEPKSKKSKSKVKAKGKSKSKDEDDEDDEDSDDDEDADEEPKSKKSKSKGKKKAKDEDDEDDDDDFGDDEDEDEDEPKSKKSKSKVKAKSKKKSKDDEDEDEDLDDDDDDFDEDEDDEEEEEKPKKKAKKPSKKSKR